MDSTTTITTSTEAASALKQRGVNPKVADQLAGSATPDLIGSWCTHHDHEDGRMGPGAVVNAIRYGQPPPERHRPGQRSRDDDRVPQWLRSKLPSVCDEHGDPHPAAVLAARRIEFRYGSLSAREHAQAIRGAVEDFEAEAAER